MTTATLVARPGSAAGRMLRQTMTDSWYLLVGFPLGVASFTVIVSGLSIGLGSLFLLGLPIAVATLYAARGFAELERRRIRPVLRVAVVHPRYQPAPADASLVRRLVAPMADWQYWLDVLHGLLAFVVATVTFTLLTLWWSAAVSGTLYVVYGWFLPDDPSSGLVVKGRQLSDLLGMGGTVGRVVLTTSIGFFFLGTLPLAVRVLAVGQARLSRTLLSGVAEMRQRISGLEMGKATAEAQTAAAVSAEASALRRLERDIHDGPQQRLVRLAMDLGRAQQQWDTDPEAARQITAEALVQTQETLNELRALSRGIAPPILTDRGLPAALAALAARNPVEVELETTLVGRLHPAIEGTAYFVVAEALTNVAKHSMASLCRVCVERLGDRLMVIIVDDGVGGAAIAKGHGLAGLADRAQAAGGTLTVISPPGGPTTITAELPWH
ncbi:MAG TPA: sensor domain-containing protein [Rugosimonospora sp.]|nr:sensor domain-containing protein [Rugosimonospora sp.]